MRPRRTRRRADRERAERVAGCGGRRGRLRRGHGRALGRRRPRRSSCSAPRPSRTMCTACWPQQGIVTLKGGRTSHAALVARQFGKPAVVGVGGPDAGHGAARAPPRATSSCKRGRLAFDRRHARRRSTRESSRPWFPTSRTRTLLKILEWADEFRRLDPCARTPTTHATRSAHATTAPRGIGLCRTEHMFFETQPSADRAANDPCGETASERKPRPIAELLPLQREDFAGLFRAMSGLPVVSPAARSAAARVLAGPTTSWSRSSPI